MKLRVFTEPQQGASYDDLLRVARATEDLGFDAFFRSDHLLRIGDGDPGPGSTDAWTTLAGLARETNRIRLGTMVTSATFRLPGLLAIAVAQIDHMSGGRVELGIGAGWYEREHTAYGVLFPEIGERFSRLEEQVAIIDGLWTTPVGQTFNFDGQYYSLTDSPALPKPVQSPRPPIILGGEGKKRSAALAARYADEYNAFATLDDAAQRFTRIRNAVAEAGRPAESMHYSVARTVCLGKDDAELARRADAIGRSVTNLRDDGLAGTPQEVVDRIGQFAAIGATVIYLQVLDLSDLDHLELIASEVAPQVASSTL
jgi:F420-dependent oxidoreductase-like protein